MRSKLGDKKLALRQPSVLWCPPLKLKLQLPICAQTLTHYPVEEGSTLEEKLTEWTWMEPIGYRVGKYFHKDRTGWLNFKSLSQLVYCALTGYLFVCQVDKQPWATKCLCNHSTPMQCMLGTLITLFSTHSSNEYKHWASSLKIFTWVTQDLPRNIPDGDFYFFGYALLPWWGIATHQVLRNLSRTLTTIASETAKFLTNLQESLDSLDKEVLGNQLALDCLLAEQRGVCANCQYFLLHIC